jgi:hypothetical protein
MNCSGIQILEPSGDVPVGEPGAFDPSLQEFGSLPLNTGVFNASVVFTTPKVTANYRFEYLYVDDLGVVVSPSVISVVPTVQTTQGFSVIFTGAPIATGYTLQWRVVVASLVLPENPLVDQPESFYVNLPLSNTFTYSFLSPRSNTTYGFSELRVENLVDTFPILGTGTFPMVIRKTQLNFTVLLSSVPGSGNYYLVGRTP